jgi:hypothetical protein
LLISGGRVEGGQRPVQGGIIDIEPGAEGPGGEPRGGGIVAVAAD